VKTIPSRATLAIVAGAAAIISVTACSASIGTPKVDKDDLATQISSKLEQQVGHKPDKVECPSNLDGQKDATLTCTLTDQGTAYDVHVTVTNVDGDKVSFDIKVDDTPKS
jgi:hypothetical protein